MEGISTPFTGTWTYRSFINDPNHHDDVNNLLFGEGELRLDDRELGSVTGHISFGTDYQLILNGGASYGAPFSIRFQGVGQGGSKAEGWIYDYLGYLVPHWPNGVDQRPAIVGSVIRTVPHSQGQALAGYVASFIAVKRG